MVYTEYNPYTITSRPSNRHGGVNFSALNKKDGSRESFIPPDGSLFLQFDYDNYHVRLIGKLIKYKLPDTSVHQWLKTNMVVRMMNPKEEHSVSYMVV